MRSIVIAGPGRIEFREQPAPEPGAGELLLAPLAVGLCRTDLELADGSMVYLRQGLATFPLTPGHEWVARVVRPGEGVLGFAPGDLVVGECSIGCSHCRLCLSGSYHQCPDRAETGLLRQAGAMSGLFSFPARAAHRVPADVAVEDAAFAEPAAVALRAVQRADWRPGRSVLVVGAGTIGWLVAAIALDVHGADVAIMDVDAGRVGRAEAMGARRAAPDERFDIVIEASGHPSALQQALASLAPGGRLVVLGLFGQPQLPVDIDRIVVSDQTLTGSLGSPGVWRTMLSLLGRGRLKPSALVTGRYALAEAPAAYVALAANAPGTGKLLIFPQESDRD